MRRRRSTCSRTLWRAAAATSHGFVPRMPRVSGAALRPVRATRMPPAAARALVGPCASSGVCSCQSMATCDCSFLITLEDDVCVQTCAAARPQRAPASARRDTDLAPPTRLSTVPSAMQALLACHARAKPCKCQALHLPSPVLVSTRRRRAFGGHHRPAAMLTACKGPSMAAALSHTPRRPRSVCRPSGGAHGRLLLS